MNIASILIVSGYIVLLIIIIKQLRVFWRDSK